MPETRIRNIMVRNLTARHVTKTTPEIYNISFSLNSGEMMAVMGPSGSGKSSIISALLDKMKIEQGIIHVNGRVCPRGLFSIRRQLGHAPQGDILDGALTVRENLLFYQRLKTWSSRPEETIEGSIDTLLESFGIQHKKNMAVAGKARLSGGQRRRLNMGMELLNQPELLLLDEPTSGLSSKDSEKVIDQLKTLTAAGTIVIIVIHQPSSVIYKKFDQVLVLNREGEQLFVGPPLEALTFFNDVFPDRSMAVTEVECSACKNTRPEILLDAQEEVSPDFWKTNPPPDPQLELPPPGKDKMLSPALTFQEALKQFPLQVKRQMLKKSRDRLNQILTLVIPPVLGILIASVFKYAPDGEPYSIVTNQQYPHFLFLSIITGMFFGLMAGVFEIIKDEPLLQRERLNDISINGYFTAKYLVLALFGMVQCLAFLIPAHWILGVEHMLWVNAGLMALITFIGIAFGLLFSTLTSSVLAAYNFVPLILIPQIILGGGFLPFDRTGDGLYFIERHCNTLLEEKCPWQYPADKTRAPVIARLLPASWAFEFLVTANYDLHPVGRNQRQRQRELNEIDIRYQTLRGQAATLTQKRELDVRKNNEIDVVNQYHDQVFNQKSPSLNETIQNIGTGNTPLRRGDFTAPRHDLFQTEKDALPARTWFLDIIVLSAYLVILLGIGFVRVSIVARRR